MSSRPSRKRCRCAALVQASLERLQNAEASWDWDVRASGAMFDGFPTAEQVLMHMSRMSRERQRMCLAQRGKRRLGNPVRAYETLSVKP